MHVYVTVITCVINQLRAIIVSEWNVNCKIDNLISRDHSGSAGNTALKGEYFEKSSTSNFARIFLSYSN